MTPSSRALSGKRILITGGTGSFGRAVLRRIAELGVEEVMVFSRDEKKQDDMRRVYGSPRVKWVIGDVRDLTALTDAMSGIDHVFHAAALKQVPSCEFYPMEAVRTNVIGTENVFAAAVSNRVSHVVLLSTDKAAYPINAMGMSKALAEKVMAAKSRVAADKGTILCCTRYGNVLASRGSVVPLFMHQAAAGKRLTVTDPTMTRFILSIEEAVDLVLYAFENAEPGDLFVRKAPAATMESLATAVQRMFNRNDSVQIIGTRHGEKLYETLLTREEMAHADDRGDYFRVPADARDLNYQLYFTEGERRISKAEDYHSHNAPRLRVDQIVELIGTLKADPSIMEPDAA